MKLNLGLETFLHRTRYPHPDINVVRFQMVRWANFTTEKLEYLIIGDFSLAPSLGSVLRTVVWERT